VLLRQPVGWEQTFANHILDKGSYPAYIKNSDNSTIKTDNLNRKWGKGLNRPFSKEGTQKASKSMRKCWLSLIFSETQIKAILYIRMPAVKNKQNQDDKEDLVKEGP
jgi:hypothetical protein